MPELFDALFGILTHEANQQIAVALVVEDDLRVQAEALDAAGGGHMGTGTGAGVHLVANAHMRFIGIGYRQIVGDEYQVLIKLNKQ